MYRRVGRAVHNHHHILEGVSELVEIFEALDVKYARNTQDGRTSDDEGRDAPKNPFRMR
jgi:hypothetical protein